MLDARNLFFVDILGPPPGTDVLHGGPSLIQAVRGVTVAEAVWKPSPDAHSVWGLVLHSSYWKYIVRNYFEQEEADKFERSGEDWFDLPKNPDEEDWIKDQSLWRDEHRKLREAVAKLPPKRWDLIPQGGKKHSYAQLVVAIVSHDAYHTGQIRSLLQLVKTKKIKARPSVKRVTVVKM